MTVNALPSIKEQMAKPIARFGERRVEDAMIMIDSMRCPKGLPVCIPPTEALVTALLEVIAPKLEFEKWLRCGMLHVHVGYSDGKWYVNGEVQ